MVAQSGVVILDRDGVINHDSDDYIKSPSEWQPISGSAEAIAALTNAGFRIGVATNQSGLARGLFDEDTLTQIHHKMQNVVEAAGGNIDAISYCPHLPDAGCNCRKPATGLLEELQSTLSCKLQGSPFVGDSFKDLEAALAFGMEPVLVRTGKGAITEQKVKREGLDVRIFDDLAQAVNSYLLDRQ